MPKNNIKRIFFLMTAFVALACIIYFYFLNWRTDTIYGDDINIYNGYFGLHGFIDKMNMDLGFEKYRPVHGIAVQFLIEFFHKHLKLYYAFNVGVQAANALIMAFTINLFLRSPLLSL